MFNRLLVRPLGALLLVAGCGGIDTAGTVDDVPAAPRAKAPETVWRARVAQEPRSLIVAVSPTGTAPPAAGCTAGTTLYAGSATSFVHAVAARAAWSYRLCATDGAGNAAPGIAKTATALAQ